jgi:hypothetical protein
MQCTPYMRIVHPVAARVTGPASWVRVTGALCDLGIGAVDMLKRVGFVRMRRALGADQCIYFLSVTEPFGLNASRQV